MTSPANIQQANLVSSRDERLALPELLSTYSLLIRDGRNIRTRGKRVETVLSVQYI